jgi:hypothetical protein
MTDVLPKPDFIHLTTAWIGLGAVVLAVALLLVPADVTRTSAWSHLHEISVSGWATVWLVLGVATLTTSFAAWRLVLWPLTAMVMLMLFWSAMSVAAAGAAHGHGMIGGVVWCWFAGTVWFAAIRAARTPILVGSKR